MDIGRVRPSDFATRLLTISSKVADCELRVYDGSPCTAEVELDDRDGRLPIADHVGEALRQVCAVQNCTLVITDCYSSDSPAHLPFQAALDVASVAMAFTEAR